MRDIKFRIMVYCAISSVNKFEYVEIKVEDMIIRLKGAGQFEYCLALGEPMQFTGLKDINGVDIYEGDVIGIDDVNFVVTYRAPSYILLDCDGGQYHSGDYYEGYNPYTYEWGSLEVIGNIHHNPELLESK
jgi:uncharacterized phage protein (TIGR01671 family)